jgi:5-methylcytosine-specific restriction protein A
MCAMQGRITEATVADHIEPHKGDLAKFNGPIQSLCKLHHDGAKQSEERTGRLRGCDANGYPNAGWMV